MHRPPGRQYRRFLYATPAPGTNFTDLAMSFGIKVVDIGQEAVDKLMAEKP